MKDILYKNLFNYSDQAIIYWDKKLNLIKANKAAATLYGFKSPDEMIGLSFYSLLSESETDLIKRLNESIENNELIRVFEKRIISKDGVKWVESHVSPIKLKDSFIIQEIDYDITERKKIEQALTFEKSKFENYFNMSPTINVVLDRKGCISDINQKALEILGVSKSEVLGLNWFDNFIPEDIKENIKKVFIDMVNGKIKHVENYENEIITKDGEKRIISWKNSYIKENDEVIYVISSGIDITREKKYLERIEYENIFINEFIELSNKLLNSESDENIYKIIIDNLVEIIPHAQAGAFVLLNDQGEYEYKAMNGYDIKHFTDVRLKNELNDRNILEPYLVENWNKEYKYPKSEKDIFDKYGKINEIKETLYIPLTVKGELYGAITLDTFDNKFENYEFNFAKIIKANLDFLLWKIQANKQLRQAAEFDYLTKIYNRQAFMIKIKDIIKIAKRNSMKLAFIYMDINKFKTFNDKYGHNVGDEVLKFFTKKVSSVIRESDIFARIGGDEFIVVLNNADYAGAKKVIEKIQKSLEDPFVFEKLKINISSSYGISVFPDDGENVDLLIEIADKRMYEYKNKSR